MDINNYISSGILEDYVLGLLPLAEAREVERHAVEYPEIKSALRAIEDSLEQYAQLHAVTPPDHLKAKILQRFSSGTTPTPSARSDNGGTTSGSGLLPWILGGLLAFATGYALYISQQNNHLQEQIIAGQTQLERVEMACDTIQSQLLQTEAQLNILRSPDNQSIIMKGTEAHPEAIAAVHWNKIQQQNYLDVINLPTPPSDKQYQLWAIVEGKPVDMGVFDVNVESGTFVSVPFINTPQAFAITLEDLGGKPQPNLEQLYVIGNVG